MYARRCLAVLLFAVLQLPLAPRLGVVWGAEAAPVGLYPEIQPLRTGFLKVSALHEIYYELSGNPQGAPVVVLDSVSV